MLYWKSVILIFIVLLSAGCLETIIPEKVQVMYVNVSVEVQDNTTVIKSIQARGGEVSKVKAPGVVLPEKFPAIYAEVLQESNASRPGFLKTISAPNGIDYKGAGNYSFTVQILENALNKSMPVSVYSEITDGKKRLARKSVLVNWTESKEAP